MCIRDRLKLSYLSWKWTKAPGVDLVGTSMLVELADEISNTVADLFNKSLISGKYLQAGNWQMLQPYLKKGKKIKCAQL